MLFTELPLCDTLQEGLQAMNFKETTPIQEQAIPVILNKKDVIACAQTGTGKTAAFLLPLLDNLQTDTHEENKINAIVMAPTRELAQQIDQQMEGFSYFTPFSSVAVYGGNDGEAWDVQKRGLLSGADVVIATPGRLLSHINLYNIDFSGVKYFILDEADRMLDMGFHDDIMKIEKLLPKQRQTIMFSATMPTKIQQLAKSILRNPVDITIAISRPPESIMQSAYICHEAQKINIVKYLFKEKAPDKVILFSGSKQKVKEIAKLLRNMGLSAGEMHSDLDQSQRNHVMHEFKNERVNILVATDIVARGIDIDDITLIINFDVPYDAEDYVHRIGRTARAGDSGMAITFVSPDEQFRFSRIEQFLGKKIYRIPVPSELGETPEYNPVRDNRGRGASIRSLNGAGKKGKESGKKKGKSSGRDKRPGGATEYREPGRVKNSGRTENPAELVNPTELVNQERLGGTEREGKPIRPENQASRSGGRSHENQTVRSEGNARKGKSPREQGAFKKQGEFTGEGNSPRGGESQKQGKSHHRERGTERERTQKQGESQKQGEPQKQGEQRESQRKVKQGRDGMVRQHGRPGDPEQESIRGEKRAQATRKQKAPRRSYSTSADISGKKPAMRTPSDIKKGSTSQRPDPVSQQATTTEKRKRWSWWPFGKK